MLSESRHVWAAKNRRNSGKPLRGLPRTCTVQPAAVLRSRGVGVGGHGLPHGALPGDGGPEDGVRDSQRAGLGGPEAGSWRKEGDPRRARAEALPGG